MLYFYDTKHNQAYFEWHIGKDLPLHTIDFDGWNAVSADGQELKFICVSFPNLRRALSDTVYWEGEDARFILDNFKGAVKHSDLAPPTKHLEDF